MNFFNPKITGAKNENHNLST